MGSKDEPINDTARQRVGRFPAGFTVSDTAEMAGVDGRENGWGALVECDSIREAGQLIYRLNNVFYSLLFDKCKERYV